MGKKFWPAAALRASLLSATAIMAMTGAVSAQEQRQTFNIPAQNTADALTEFARQAQIQILFPHATASRFNSPALQDDFTRREAIGRLIAGSGLVVRSDDGRSIVLAKSTAASLNQFGEDATPIDDEEIVVTGTHIRGIGDGANHVIALDRADIERSGYASTQQVLEAIPQNFSGGALGASEDGLVGGGAQAQINNESASGVNLRGLGANSTLVLINGRRVAPSAFGSSVDVSMIPLSAIDRVEVLADGSSAIYGADAVAGVVNFVLRDSLDGGETQARFGVATQGSLQEETIGHAQGFDWGAGSGLVSLQYHSRDALASADRSFTETAPQPTDLLPEVEDYSALVTARHDLTERVSLNADILYADKGVFRRFATMANAETARTDIEQLNVTLGASIDLFSDWQLRLSGAYNDQTTQVHRTSNPPSFFPNGPLTLDNRFELTSLDAVADGTVFRLPAGAVRLAIGAAHAEQDFVSVTSYTDPLLDPLHERRFDRTVDTVFGELFLPLAENLDVSLALRYDDYSDFGDTTNPRVGVV